MNAFWVELVGFIQHPVSIAVLSMTVIQIAPIKVNPWSWIAKKIKQWLIGDLKKSVESLQKDVVKSKVDNKRWFILDFANSCRQGRRHTKEEWEHCIDEIAWYENYCAENNIINGVISEGSAYLRRTYHKLLEGNDFLV